MRQYHDDDIEAGYDEAFGRRMQDLRMRKHRRNQRRMRRMNKNSGTSTFAVALVVGFFFLLIAGAVVGAVVHLNSEESKAGKPSKKKKVETPKADTAEQIIKRQADLDARKEREEKARAERAKIREANEAAAKERRKAYLEGAPVRERQRLERVAKQAADERQKRGIRAEIRTIVGQYRGQIEHAALGNQVRKLVETNLEKWTEEIHKRFTDLNEDGIEYADDGVRTPAWDGDEDDPVALGTDHWAEDPRVPLQPNGTDGGCRSHIKAQLRDIIVKAMKPGMLETGLKYCGKGLGAVVGALGGVIATPFTPVTGDNPKWYCPNYTLAQETYDKLKPSDEYIADHPYKAGSQKLGAAVATGGAHVGTFLYTLVTSPFKLGWRGVKAAARNLNCVKNHTDPSIIDTHPIYKGMKAGYDGDWNAAKVFANGRN